MAEAQAPILRWTADQHDIASDMSSARLAIVGAEGSGKTAALCLRAALLREQGMRCLWVLARPQGLADLRPRLVAQKVSVIPILPNDLALRVLNKHRDIPMRPSHSGVQSEMAQMMSNTVVTATPEQVAAVLEVRRRIRLRGEIRADGVTNAPRLDLHFHAVWKGIDRGESKPLLEALEAFESSLLDAGVVDGPGACAMATAQLEAMRKPSAQARKRWALIVDGAEDLAPVHWRLLVALAPFVHSLAVSITDHGQTLPGIESARGEVEGWIAHADRVRQLRTQLRLSRGVAGHVQCQRRAAGTDPRLSIDVPGLGPGGDFTGECHPDAGAMLEVVVGRIADALHAEPPVLPQQIGVVSRSVALLDLVGRSLEQAEIRWVRVGSEDRAGVLLWTTAETLARLAADSRDLAAILGLAAVHGGQRFDSVRRMLVEAQQNRIRVEAVVEERKTVSGRWMMRILEAARTLPQRGVPGLMDAVYEVMEDAPVDSAMVSRIDRLGQICAGQNRSWASVVSDIRMGGWRHAPQGVQVCLADDVGNVEWRTLYVIGYSDGFFPMPGRSLDDERRLLCHLFSRASQHVELHHAERIAEIDPDKKFKLSPLWVETGLGLPEGAVLTPEDHPVFSPAPVMKP